MIIRILFILCSILVISCSESDDIQPIDETDTVATGKITQQLLVNGENREYIIHVPSTYSSSNSYPLVLAFHGLGGSMESSYSNSGMHVLAERENFIVVHPNGISNQWNAVTFAGNKDVDFLALLLNQVEEDYSINPNRIYTSGMSNGGFFSFLLACEFSDRIAAVGSVTGLMFNRIFNNCQPNRPIPVIQIHGTEDAIVDYEGVERVINFWVNHNKSSTEFTTSLMADIDSNDGSKVERYIYSNGDNDTEVHHLKVIGGGHDWPGYRGNMDISATEELWSFFNNYDLNGRL